MFNGHVYLVTNKINGKVYVGQSTGKFGRRGGSNGKGYKNNKHFYDSILKHGWENFIYELLFEYSNEDKSELIKKLDEVEISYIKRYKSYMKKYGYNIKLGGSNSGYHSEDTKSKISKANKGKIHIRTPEQIESQRQKLIGRKYSEEHRRNISEALKGKKKSEEHRKKISEVQKGRTIPEERKERIRKTMTGKKFGPCSEERKKNISEAKKRKNLERKALLSKDFN